MFSECGIATVLRMQTIVFRWSSTGDGVLSRHAMQYGGQLKTLNQANCVDTFHKYSTTSEFPAWNIRHTTRRSTNADKFN